MKVLIVSAILICMTAFLGEDPLVGRWESQPSVKGNITGVLFKNDGSFEGYVNKKPFVSGKYSTDNGVLKFIDNGCGGKSAEYTLVFFSKGDSLRFDPIVDSCLERKNGMSHLVLGRKKY